ncbi:MAG: hypothetical protein Q9227_005277 [Pyrenula ochraceoflavens]
MDATGVPAQLPKVYGTGMTVLHNPTSANTDIVFIHGIQGSPERTWTAKAPSKTFWPLDLLPRDCPYARIMTFGYDSVVTRGLKAVNQNDLFAHAQSLRRILLEDAIRVAGHGLAPVDEKDIYLSTFATVFLGTPFRGSSAAEWALLAELFVKMIGLGTNSKILKELKLDSGALNILRSEFRECVKQRAINVRCFQESKGLSGIKGLHEQIVLEASSKLDEDTICQSLNYNHMEMCRYATRDDEGYQIVGDEVAFWAKKASEFHGHHPTGIVPVDGSEAESRLQSSQEQQQA